MATQVWTDAQFLEMSWHDNHVHGMQLVEMDHGSGELILDIDYIVEWIKGQDAYRFLIVPATLTFHGVTSLRFSLDYATPTAAFGPFMIHGIERHQEQRDRYLARLWKILISWPQGELAFEGAGFTQRALGEAVQSERQCLSQKQRGRAV